uniref:Secreted protein n=1 Tax=Romanomermis culicivorax TaxID=13658 RepID=A0A915HS20_ROMCU
MLLFLVITFCRIGRLMLVTVAEPRSVHDDEPITRGSNVAVFGTRIIFDGSTCHSIAKNVRKTYINVDEILSQCNGKKYLQDRNLEKKICGILRESDQI